MSFELFIAARYLKAKRKQAVISIITVISVIGVAAGVASLIIALAVNAGFKEDLQKRLLGATANINLLRIENDGIRDYESLIERLAKVPHVVALAPAIYEQVLLSSGTRAKGVVLKGIDVKRELRVGDLLQSVRQGRLDALQTDTQEYATAPAPLAVGKDLAESLGVEVGDVVMAVSPQGNITPTGIIPRYKKFRVAAIYDSGFFDYDSAWVFTSLPAAQNLFSLPDVASVIEFKIDDIYRASEVAAELKGTAGAGYTTVNWMEQNRSLFQALKLEKVVTIITIGLIVLVAALNILITLVMMVMEKNRDIAILVAMGARLEQIRKIFIWQGVIIGVVGTVFGGLVGYSVSWVCERYHLIALNADIYSFAYVPFKTRASDGLLIAAAAILISFLSTLYPARSAARVSPVEVLRYE
ncbi:MAG: ABC transporter permease [Acidobacteriia bacterium]|nr:ABC transporter permease [Terriglobia bacterium]